MVFPLPVRDMLYRLSRAPTGEYARERCVLPRAGVEDVVADLFDMDTAVFRMMPGAMRYNFGWYGAHLPTTSKELVYVYGVTILDVEYGEGKDTDVASYDSDEPGRHYCYESDTSSDSGKAYAPSMPDTKGW